MKKIFTKQLCPFYTKMEWILLFVGVLFSWQVNGRHLVGFYNMSYHVAPKLDFEIANRNSTTAGIKSLLMPTPSSLMASSTKDILPAEDHLFRPKSNNGSISNPLMVDREHLTANSNLVLAQIIGVNFQNPGTIPPAGWVRDYGQPYGARTGAYQGTNLVYGWRRRTDGSLLDLSVGGTNPGNGRNRNSPANVLLATLMHMQADDITGTFNGTKAEGYWELKVAPGIYDVSVSVGDAEIGSHPESHCLNVEGVKAITNFVSSGAAGTLTRFKSATVRVSVMDGNLTINADGGINTKINSVQVVPVATSSFVYWSANAQELTIKKETTTTQTFSLELSNSANRSDIQYAVSVVYNTPAASWLTFNTTHTGTEPNVTFNYTAAKNLVVGTYQATVTASTSGFTSGSFIVRVKVEANRPYVISSSPANGATNVSVNTASIAANNLYVPVVAGYPGGVNNATITNTTVKLLKVVGTSSTNIAGIVQGTGGGDAISFSPDKALEGNTRYKFIITDGVKSHSGLAFIPYEASFTTGAVPIPTNTLPVQFTKVPIAGTQGKKYTSLVIGPDSKFYALRLDGVIERFVINRTDGTLTYQAQISTLVTKYGNRSAIGLVFDPAATATNLIAYVSHCSNGLSAAPAFDGKISRLSGASLGTEQLLITNLPRSMKDHLVNSLAFGPDGAMYFNQGSNSSMGAFDGTWQREESLLSAAVLRLDFQKLSGLTLPLDVKTTSNQSLINSAPATSMRFSDGSYNPYASNSPVTIYASGVRNAYDLIWHPNGQLYVPTNGSAAGGNSPPSIANTRRPNGTKYTGPTIPATTGVKVQNDWLFRINPLKPVGYFGHPNPYRGEYVTHRGYTDNPLYPTTIIADANYRGAAFNFETNKSPNGALVYKSNAFNGALKNKILVCRFSGGSDIIVLEPGSMVKDPSVTSATSDDRIYNIVRFTTGSGTNGIPGLAGFTNPLDIVEDVITGNLYVIEFNWNNTTTRTAQITLLRVTTPTTLQTTTSVVHPNSADLHDMSNESVPFLEVSPNPNSGDKVFVQISNFGKRAAVTLTMHDLLGHLLSSKNITTDQKGAGTTEIELKGELKAGLYLIKASGQTGMQSQKLLIK